jgi:hypothetical protein
LAMKASKKRMAGINSSDAGVSPASKPIEVASANSQDRVGTLNIELSVAEPWDFSSPDGENFLRGTCDLDTSAGRRGTEDYIIVECTPFPIDGIMVTSLSLTPRHMLDRSTLIQRIRNGEEVDVNAGYLKQGLKWTNELAQAPDSNVRQYWTSFLISSAVLNPPGVKRRNTAP